MKIYELLFELLRFGLFDAELFDNSVELLKNEEMQKKVFIAAKKHDIAHLVSYSLDKANLLDKQSAFGQKCVNEQFMAVYRYENINYELERICKTLDEAEIPFILLKGAVIRRFYPEPWMRTSCDIDILVKEDIVEKVKDILVEKLDYMFERKGDHDYQLRANNNVHLELHYRLIKEGEMAENSYIVLNSVWEYTVKEKKYTWGYRFDDAMFYYYHLIHLAKHIKFTGGCGIKPFLDLFVFDTHIVYSDKTKALIKQGGLEKTEAAAQKLSRVYFGGEEYDELSKILSEYVLGGGVYGNIENRVAISRGDTGGVIKYALSRIFAPREVIEFRYPEVEKKKWLFIPYQFRRWFDLVFKGNIKKSLNELDINKNLSQEKINSAAKMWNDLGL